jgi:uncharacterized protein YggE
MDGKVVVSVKSLLLAGLVLLGLMAAYVWGSSGGNDSISVAAAEDSPAAEAAAGVIRMVGKGEASAVPDQLSFNLAVTVKQADLDAALSASSATMKRVLGTLEEYGVKAGDVRTTGLSMNPEYAYPNNSAPILTGYRVTQSARVVVTDLSKAGKAISAAVAGGGNSVRIRGIALGIGDTDAVIAEARDAAVEQATAKAEQYAAATGQSLGAVLSIKEVSVRAPSPQPMYELRAASIAGDAAVPIRAGESDLAVRVEVAWSFE